MQYSIDELKKIRQEYIQKQSDFKKAFLFQTACLKKIGSLVCIKIPFNYYKKTSLSKLFSLLDRRLILADKKLEAANLKISQTTTLKQFETCIDKYQINNIDKDLSRALKISKKLCISNIKKGFVYNEVYASLEQTNYICCKLYYNAICQLQFCIDFIDNILSKSIEIEKM